MSSYKNQEAIWYRRRHHWRPISYVDGEILHDLDRVRESMEQNSEANIEARTRDLAEQTRQTVESIENQSSKIEEMGLWTVDAIRDQTDEYVNALNTQSEQLATEIQDVAGRITGLSGNITQLESTTQDGFLEMVTTLNSIARESFFQTQQMISLSERMVFALENPNQTRAREFLSRGIHAYTNGWWEEAKEEFVSACELFRYDPIGWYYRARIALWIDGQTSAAHELVDNSIKYAGPVDVPLQAQSHLLKADIFCADEEFPKALSSCKNSLKCNETTVGFLKAAKLSRVVELPEETTLFLRQLIGMQPDLVVVLGQNWTEPVRAEVAKWVREIMRENTVKARSLFTETSDIYKSMEAIDASLVRSPLNPLSRIESAAQNSLSLFEQTCQSVRHGFDSLFNSLSNSADQLYRASVQRRSTELENNFLHKNQTMEKEKARLSVELETRRKRIKDIEADIESTEKSITHRSESFGQSARYISRPEPEGGLHFFLALISGVGISLVSAVVIGIVALFIELPSSMIWISIVVGLGFLPLLILIKNSFNAGSEYDRKVLAARDRERQEIENLQLKSQQLSNHLIAEKQHLDDFVAILDQREKSTAAVSEQLLDSKVSEVKKQFSYLEELENYSARLRALEESWHKLLFEPKHRSLLQNTKLTNCKC